MEQQKMCDEQARKKFNEDYGTRKGYDYEYTSHFDARANVCYMLVHGTADACCTVSYLVYDAFEGRVYASYVWINPEHKKGWEVDPTDCSVKPRGQASIVCKSSDEFEDLVDKYFGISR